ncbi:MAG TPA: hypothetical protein VK599_13100, partial [Streptosporangiaceae bacterium]|nr:hypothetical protein [Streptosporangiaceae bacterium]
MAGHLPYQALPQATRPAPRWQAWTVLLALVPVVSCGLLGFVPAAVLAVLRRTVAGWVGLSVTAAMTCAEATLAGTSPNQDPGALAGFYFILTIIGSVLYYVLSLSRWQRSDRRAQQAVPYYPQPQPAQYPHTQPQSPSYPYPEYPAPPLPSPVTE